MPQAGDCEVHQHRAMSIEIDPPALGDSAAIPLSPVVVEQLPSRQHRELAPKRCWGTGVASQPQLTGS